jgi:hypothetical protein
MKRTRAASPAHQRNFHEEDRMKKMHLTATLLILQASWTLSAQEMSFGSCQVFGQVFGVDPIVGDMLVKSPSAGIGGLRFDGTTAFTRAALDAGSSAPARITPPEVNNGDLICARATKESDSVIMAGSRVLVASRREIQEQQKASLVQWSKFGASGEVVKLNEKEGSFILERTLSGGSTGNLLVETSRLTRFRRYPAGLAHLTDATAAPTAHIRVGDWLYVRGDPSANGASMKARVILLDGFQALTATIDSLDALAETVTLHELSTEKPIEVRIRHSDLFLLNPGLDPAQNETSESPRGRKLQTLDFGDLQEGDSVVVVGKFDDSSGRMKGIALIADFGEVTPKQTGLEVSWTLGSMKLDLP